MQSKRKDQGGANQAINTMMRVMDEHYSVLKDKGGIYEGFLDTGKHNVIHRLEDVFRSIRPNCNAKNFREYLKYEENQHKNQKWRTMVREAHKDEPEFNEEEFEPTELRVK